MAKEDRVIHHGIRVMKPQEGKNTPESMTFTSGMEDELAAAFTQAQLDVMKARGDISGKWKSTKK